MSKEVEVNGRVIGYDPKLAALLFEVEVSEFDRLTQIPIHGKAKLIVEVQE